jgi:TonB family protein
MKSFPRVRVVVAFRAARSRLTRFMTGSMAVHGVLLAAVLIVPATRHRPTPIDDSMTVSLVGPLATSTAPSGASASAPAHAPAPKIAKPPAPAPPPKEAHTVREVPKPKPKSALVKIKKDPPKTPDTEETEEPTSPDAPDASEAPDKSATGPRTGPGAPQAAGGGAVTASVGGGDSSLGWYGAAVKAALEAAWVKPYLEDAGGTASVVLAFDIARDGTPRNIRIETSSGIQSLDRSAQRAAIEAAPFPAPPPTWTGDTIPVTMRFDLSPESH